jgi:hypothetical protein
MQCPRCKTRNPTTSTRCRVCGGVLPPPPTVAHPPAAPTVTHAPAIVAPAGPVITPLTASNWERFSGFLKRKFRRTPTPQPTQTAQQVDDHNDPPTQEKLSKILDWLKSSVRLVIAVACTGIWLFGIIQQNLVLGTIPAIGMLYYVPLPFAAVRHIRMAITIFWILLCAVIITAWRSKK